MRGRKEIEKDASEENWDENDESYYESDLETLQRKVIIELLLDIRTILDEDL